MKFECQYCKKSFAKETTLMVHVCEQKKRFQSQNETGIQIGLKSYLQFYESSQGIGKKKTFDDFATSPYYRAFARFGQYCVSIRAINIPRFVEWLLKNNKKIDFWCKDTVYEEFLAQYLRVESVTDALERAIREMQDYAEANPDLKNGISDYFRYGNTNRLFYHISTGRVSSWIVYNCKSGIEFLNGLQPDQISMIWNMIDSDFWQKKFSDHAVDVEYVKDILKKAGL
jgi:hypothetical protein